MPSYEHLPWPAAVHHAIFLDFDETVRPSSDTHRATAGIDLLEARLASLCLDHGVLVGWVTGSNLEAVLDKARGYVRRFPHFIGSSLGTQLHWMRDGHVLACPWWPSRVVHADFDDALLDRVVGELADRGMVLTPQEAAYQGPYKRAYYWRGQGAGCVSHDVHRHVRMLLQKCNPAAGDPEDAWDVDLIPTACGKDGLVRHVMGCYDIDPRDAFAFGDSMNDVPMLNAVGRPHLVANAERSVRRLGYPTTRGAYCLGIVEALDAVFPRFDPEGSSAP